MMNTPYIEEITLELAALTDELAAKHQASPISIIATLTCLTAGVIQKNFSGGPQFKQVLAITQEMLAEMAAVVEDADESEMAEMGLRIPGQVSVTGLVDHSAEPSHPEIKSAVFDVDGWILFGHDGDPIEKWPEGWEDKVNSAFLKAQGVRIAA